MVTIDPFSITPVERQEIRQVCNIVFSGGDATAYEETKEWYYKWFPFINVFLQSVDRRTGAFLHLPFDCGAFEQPSKTMTILMVMQEVFFKHISEQFGRK